MPRRYSTTSGTTFKMCATSSSVLSAPRLKRNEPWAISWGSPSASSTWLGSNEPEVHAEPEDAATPLASSHRSKLSPSMPSKQKFTVPGQRRFRLPFRRLWGIWESPSMSRSRRAVTYTISALRLETASLSAAAMPTMPGMFSVPPRRPRSWAPPWIKISGLSPLRQ